MRERLCHDAQAADFGHRAIDFLGQFPVGFEANVDEPGGGIAAIVVNAGLNQGIDSIQVAVIDAAGDDVIFSLRNMSMAVNYESGALCAILEPPSDTFRCLLYRLPRNIQQRHGWLCRIGMFFEPASEVEHAGDECLVARPTPGGAVEQALDQCFVGADEGEVMNGAEIAAVRAGFQLTGQGSAEENDGMPALVDGYGHAEPDVPVASVIIFGCCRDVTPQDVAIQADIAGQLWREFDAESGFAHAAGAGDDEEGKLAKRVFMPAVGADGVRSGRFYCLLV